LFSVDPFCSSFFIEVCCVRLAVARDSAFSAQPFTLPLSLHLLGPGRQPLLLPLFCCLSPAGRLGFHFLVLTGSFIGGAPFPSPFFLSFPADPAGARSALIGGGLGWCAPFVFCCALPLGRPAFYAFLRLSLFRFPLSPCLGCPFWSCSLLRFSVAWLHRGLLSLFPISSPRFLPSRRGLFVRLSPFW